MAGELEDNHESSVQGVHIDDTDKNASSDKNVLQSEDDVLIPEQKCEVKDTRSPSSDFKYESERLKTFQNWTCMYVEKEKLAAAGFVSLNKCDIVRCVFCKRVLGNWVKGDDPVEEHKKFSPECPFVRGLDVGNVPADSKDVSATPAKDVSATPAKPRSYDTCGMFGLSAQAPTMYGSDLPPQLSEIMSILGISRTETLRFPEYLTVAARLETYKDWPASVKQKPEALAEAGFFYTGEGDKTICFFCRCGLIDWEDTDDPWVQHAKWSPKCPFVIMMKGKLFVDSVVKGTQE